LSPFFARTSDRDIERRNHDEEHRIEQREAPGVAVGRRRIHHRMIREEPLIHSSFPYQRDEHRSQVNRLNVYQVVEHRHAAEDGEDLSDLSAGSVRKRQEENRRPQCHQQKLERCRVLARVDEAKQGRCRVGSGRVPVAGITVDIDRSEREKEHDGCRAKGDANPVSPLRLHHHHRAKRVARCYHARSTAQSSTAP